MNIMKKLIGLTAVMALFAGQVQGQEYDETTSAAYYDSESASTMSAWLPLAALGAAAIIIAVTDNNHHHHNSSSNSSSSSSSSHSHSHY